MIKSSLRILTVFAVFLFALVLNTYSQCASSSNITSFTYNSHTYMIVEEQKSWSNAANCAVSLGGYLVEINSQAEQDTIYNNIVNNTGISSTYTSVNDGGGVAYIWIGATDQNTEGTWLWDGNDDNNGINFWNGQGAAGSGNGSPVSGRYNNWGGSSAGNPQEPDNFNNQDAAGIGLADWPSGAPFTLGTAGEWNDIDVTNQLYYIVEKNCTPSQNTDVHTACDSFTWIDGNTYTSDNNSATYVTQNSAGCDSTIMLNLDIQNNTGVDSVTACDSFTWSNGITYTSDNYTAKDTFTNEAGCDSVVTLNLNINQSTSFIDTVNACNGYTWIDGNTYTSSTDTPTHVLTTNKGCDSVVNLNLNIGATASGTDKVSACDSFTWIDGNTYTSSNDTATFTYNNPGCDSVVTLDLTINQSSSSVDQISACDSFTWTNGITYTSDNNTAKDTFMNVEGCDSVVTLNLDINQSISVIDTVVACQSFTWIDGNTYTSETDTPTYLLSTEANCDSLITLNLSLNQVDTSVQKNGSTLTANEMDATYQWLNCNDNFNPVSEATDRSFTASSDGDYAVEISKNGCTDTSACFTINTTNINKKDFRGNLSVYPNPTSGTINLKWNKNYNNALIEVMDLTGKTIDSYAVSNKKEFTFKIDRPDGIYFIAIATQNHRVMLKVVKQ